MICQHLVIIGAGCSDGMVSIDIFLVFVLELVVNKGKADMKVMRLYLGL